MVKLLGLADTDSETIDAVSLNCWIIGDDAEEIFEVKISGGTSVSSLRELVKEKNPNSLRNVDARKLRIWAVDLPIAAAYFDNYRPRQDALLPITLLSDVIPNPLRRNRLHIIVKVPPGPEDNVVMGGTQIKREELFGEVSFHICCLWGT